MPPSTSRDLEGVWGNPTSTIDWCEYNYEVTPYIAEFWNTVTNLSMIVPPLYGLHDAYRQRFERKFVLCYLALLTIGVGSWLFHMTLLYEMQLLDEIPMVFGSAMITYSISQTRQPVGSQNLPMAILLLVYCFLFVFVYLVIHKPLFQEVIYGILVFVMMVLDLELTIKQYSKVNICLFVGGMLMYLTGFLLWNVDNFYCENIRTLRQSLPSYLAPFTQLHGWWHIFAGYATYLQIISVIHHRHRFLSKKCSYDIGMMGLVVKCEPEKEEKKIL